MTFSCRLYLKYKIGKNKNTEVYDNTFEDMPDFLLRDVYNPQFFEYHSMNDSDNPWDTENSSYAISRDIPETIKPPNDFLIATPKSETGKIYREVTGKPTRGVGEILKGSVVYRKQCKQSYIFLSLFTSLFTLKRRYSKGYSVL